MNYNYCTGGCGIDFDEFPDMRHGENECSGPECTCYEIIGGHQQGCYFYGRKPAASELVEDLNREQEAINPIGADGGDGSVVLD